MNTYALTFAEWRPGPYTGDLAEFGVMRVRVGPISFPVRIVMTDTLGAMLGFLQGDLKLRQLTREAMLHVAIPHLRSKLDAMDCPSESTDTFLLTESFGSDHATILERALSIKQCAFQVKTRRGLTCDAESDSDTLRGKTSEAVCLACSLPDDRVRCSNLQHPSIIGTALGGGNYRKVNRAFCSIKTEEFEPGLCRPGGHDCWRQNVNHVPVIVEIPPDVGERAVDELSFLNLTFKDAFSRHLLRFTEPRTIAAILLGCETQEDYTSRVAAVADVLTKMDVGEVMMSEGKRVEGSLNALRALLLRERLLLNEAPIRVLRRIVDIRNSFPIHSGNQKFLAASSELGITYPPESWETAWNQVRYHLWTSLKGLRLMLSVPATPQGTDPAGT